MGFIYKSNGGRGNTEDRAIPNIRNAMRRFIQQALKQFHYLLDWRHKHTQTEMDPTGLYSAIQPRRIVLLGVSIAGYLAASGRLDAPFFSELRAPSSEPAQLNLTSRDPPAAEPDLEGSSGG